MANRTPRSAALVDVLIDVSLHLRRLVHADGIVDARERAALATMSRALQQAQLVDQQRLEAIYALNHGLDDAPSAHHARRRRELALVTNDETASAAG